MFKIDLEIFTQQRFMQTKLTQFPE